MDISETMVLLRAAAQQLVVGFEQSVKLTDRSEQIQALQDASSGLREMLLATDNLAKRLSES